jgi:hypothetical protein
MADDLNFQQISPVQSSAGLKARTIASATTIAPTTLLSKVTGSTAIATITPPVNGDHVLWLVSVDGVIVIGTGGNVLVGYSTVQNRPIAMVYDSAQGKYYCAAVV